MTDTVGALWSELEAVEFPTLTALFEAPDRLARHATTNVLN